MATTLRLLPLLLLPALAAPQAAPPAAPPEGLVTTLLAVDDLGNGLDLDDGDPGTRFVAGELLLDDVELLYGEDGLLHFGMRFRERVRLIDCGDLRIASPDQSTALAPKPPASLLHGLAIDGGQLLSTEAGGRARPLAGAKTLFGSLDPEGEQTLAPEVGHVYLLRWHTTGMIEKTGRVAALRVIEHVPGERLVLRWRPLNYELLAH